MSYLHIATLYMPNYITHTVCKTVHVSCTVIHNIQFVLSFMSLHSHFHFYILHGLCTDGMYFTSTLVYHTILLYVVSVLYVFYGCHFQAV